MPFQYKKIADVGTGHPVVARLSYQWIDILRWFDLPKPRREAVLEIMLLKVQPSVIECQRITQSLQTDVGAARNGGTPMAGLPRLKERTEEYLEKATLALRNFAGVFALLLTRDAPAANYAAIAKWAENHFGAGDPLARLLKAANEDWIRRLCDMREAARNPDAKKGPLTIVDGVPGPASTGLSLIDFDEVQRHNLDRLVGATRKDIGELKVVVAARQMAAAATAESIEIRQVPYSVVEEEGYRAALDCDVLFSCVDRPRARSILNHFAYAHLIPVIDGGIQVRFKRGEFNGADWQLQTACPGRPCLECLGTFAASDVDAERAGMLDDPRYMDNLPADHRFKNNENVFPFSANLASLEVFQLVALTTAVAGISDFGVQRFRYNPGHLESDPTHHCSPSCFCAYLTARGDTDFCLAGRDFGAERARERQRSASIFRRVDSTKKFNFRSWLRSLFGTDTPKSMEETHGRQKTVR